MKDYSHWKIRRRYIFAGFTVGVGMIIAASIAIWGGNLGAGDLVTGGVALITLILTSYCFSAVWEDISKKESHNE